ncbi:hypothetical protein [Micromonospora sp. LOL_023]|uniref:hypothetical protein n=1 Tax=Micromonospora sp. LOL_023 TaxID=3345418 RepID=UPI003A8A7D4B
MIVASLLLILVAVTLLVLGLASGSSMLLVGSIVASLLAAVALVAGARQAAAARSASLDPDGGVAPETYPGLADPDSRWHVAVGPHGGVGGAEPPHQAPPAHPAPSASSPHPAAPIARQSTGPVGDLSAAEPDDPVESASGATAAADGDPPDEPAAEEMAGPDVERLSQVDADVVVVDGRPRYHRADCVHLLARQGEPLPVREALELGFTPCSLCEPNRVLLAQAGRV